MSLLRLIPVQAEELLLFVFKATPQGTLKTRYFLVYLARMRVRGFCFCFMASGRCLDLDSSSDRPAVRVALSLRQSDGRGGENRAAVYMILVQTVVP